MKVTKKQKLLLDWLEEFMDEHQYSPSYREIASGLDYKSVSTVAAHIDNLIAKGNLRKVDHSARSLELVASDRVEGEELKVESIVDALKRKSQEMSDPDDVDILNKSIEIFTRTQGQ